MRRTEPTKPDISLPSPSGSRFAPGEMPAPSLLYLTFIAYFALCLADTVNVDLNDPSLRRSANWGQYIEKSEHAGASLSFYFTGIALSVQLARYYTYGRVNLTLDGRSNQTDTYRPLGEHVSTFCALCVTGLAPTKHSVILALIGPGQGHADSGMAWIRISSISYETAPPDTTPSDPATSDPVPSSSSSAVSDSSSSSEVVTRVPGQPPKQPDPSSHSPSASVIATTPVDPRTTVHHTFPHATASSTKSLATPPLVPSAPGRAQQSVGVIAGATTSTALVVIGIVVGLWVWIRHRRRRVMSPPPYDPANRTALLSPTDATSPSGSQGAMTARRNIKPILPDGTATGSSSIGTGPAGAPESGTEELRAEIAELRQLVTQLASPPLYA